jgi:hypothetical protein
LDKRALKQRNAAMSEAYRAARNGNLRLARSFVRQAVAFAPLTEMQMYRLGKFFGPETIDEMTGPVHHGKELLLRHFEKRMGGKP